MSIYSKISGVWRENNELNAKDGGVWKNLDTVHGKDGGVWKKIFPETIELPAGLIIFHNSDTIPSGWGRVTTADDRMIIGAGGSFSANTTGQVDISGTLGAGGSHSHSGTWSTSRAADFTAGGDSRTQRLDISTAGAHFHTIDLNVKPDRNQVVLIRKYLTNDAKLPKNAIMPSILPISGLTNIYTNSNYLSCNSSIEASLPREVIRNMSRDGYHYHPGNVTDYLDVDLCYMYQETCPNPDWWVYISGATGDHEVGDNNIIDGSITENLKHFLLSLWTKASEDFDFNSSMIAMWEGTTAPTGWKLCNGSNGTPDLRDCFIKSCVSGNEGLTSNGTNTGDAEINNVNHGNPHSHVGPYMVHTMTTTFRTYSSSNSWDHTHSGFTKTGENLVPPYYALSFIMKE